MSFDKVQDEIIDLLSDDSEQQFIFLTGAAGTGKTTLLERVKNQLSLKKNGCSSYRDCCFKHRWYNN